MEGWETAVLGTIEILQMEMLLRKQAEITWGLQSSGCYNMSLRLCDYVMLCI